MISGNSLTKKQKILELSTRKKIYNIVKTCAGCHFREIERRSKISASSVKYHLNYLSKNKLIKEEKESNNIRYFPLELNSESQKLLSLLRQRSLRKILILILSNKKCTHDEIVTSVGLSPSTVSWHLKNLLRRGIIASHKDNGKSSYTLQANEEQIINLLIAYRESFLDSLVNRAIETWDIR